MKVNRQKALTFRVDVWLVLDITSVKQNIRYQGWNRHFMKIISETWLRNLEESLPLLVDLGACSLPKSIKREGCG